MQKINILKKLLVLSNILLIISFIFSMIFKTIVAYSWFWIFILLVIIFSISIIGEVDKGRVDTDIDKSSKIKRSYNDSSTMIIISYLLAYLIIEFMDMINTNIKNNLYLIIGFFIATLVYELFLYLSIMNANKETRDLLENIK